MNRKSVQRFLIWSVLATGAAPLSSQTRLSVVRESNGNFTVQLYNSEPVAALQLTVNSTSGIILGEPGKSGRIAGPEWTMAQHRKNDSTINVVVFSASVEEIGVGSGPLLALSFSENPGTEVRRISLTRVVLSDPSAKPITTTTEDLEWTNPLVAESPFSLQQNFPNPFNPTTTIPYKLERDARVTLSVYDITGRVVKTIVDQTQRAGVYSASWNSTDDAGTVVPSGVYFVRLQVGENITARKMILAK